MKFPDGPPVSLIIAAVLCSLFWAGGTAWLACHRVEPGLVDGPYRVSRVIDGDTIELANVGRLRFADLDAPELDEPGGPEARDRLAEEIEGQIVEVEFVRRKADGMPVRDRWGRLLGTIGP